MVVNNTLSNWPGDELMVAEPVQAGDILRIGTNQPFTVGAMHVSGAGPYRVLIGSESPYDGLDSIPRNVMAGEPVEVVGRFGAREQA